MKITAYSTIRQNARPTLRSARALPGAGFGNVNLPGADRGANRRLGPPAEWALLGQIAGLPAKDAAAGAAAFAFHGLQHRPACMDVAVLPDGMVARTLAADVQADLDLLIAGSIDAEAGPGDAVRGVGGTVDEVGDLAGSGGPRLRWPRGLPAATKLDVSP